MLLEDQLKKPSTSPDCSRKEKKKVSCPHCQNDLVYNKYIENDGDRSWPIYMCIDQKCNEIVFPYYFEYE